MSVSPASRAPVRIMLWLLVVLAQAGAAQPYPNVRLDRTTPYPEEVSITIDPSNPARIVAGAQGRGCYFYSSTDHGLTWSQGELASQFDLGDPSTCFDPWGRCLFCYIGPFSNSGIYVNHSDDGGVSWRPAAEAVVAHNGGDQFEDKPYVVCDLSDGPAQGNVYVAWTRFDRYGSVEPADSSQIWFSSSIYHGRLFTPPVRVSDLGGDARDGDHTVEGAVAAAGPDGDVYLSWSGPRGIEFDRSTDGGQTWGRDRTIDAQPGGWDFKIGGVFRVNGFPVTKADVSRGRYRGRVYVLWSDQRNRDTDVWVAWSDDHGETWSEARRINGDPVDNGAHQFFPWFDVDPVTGYVYAVYYDRRENPGTNLTDVYLAVSKDGGQSFRETKISDHPFDPSAVTFMGDYSGISAYNGWIRPIWVRLDHTTLSIWTALIDPEEETPCLARVGELRVVPNPMRTVASFSICIGPTAEDALDPTEGMVLRIFDLTGRVVRSLRLQRESDERIAAAWDGRDEVGRRVPVGTYFARADEAARGRVVLAR